MPRMQTCSRPLTRAPRLMVSGARVRVLTLRKVRRKFRNIAQHRNSGTMGLRGWRCLVWPHCTHWLHEIFQFPCKNNPSNDNWVILRAVLDVETVTLMLHNLEVSLVSLRWLGHGYWGHCAAISRGQEGGTHIIREYVHAHNQWKLDDFTRTSSKSLNVTWFWILFPSCRFYPWDSIMGI